MDDLQYKILKTELDHYKSIVKSLFDLTSSEMIYTEINVPDTYINLSVLDYKSIRLLSSMNSNYLVFFKKLFTNNSHINMWVETSHVVLLAKEELKENFISAFEFKKNLEIFVNCNKHNNWEIEFKKRKNKNKNSVPHFFIKK